MPRFPIRRPREVAAFPIRYAEELPPRVGPSVPARLDVRTGAPEMYQAIAQSGAQLADMGMELISQQQQMQDTRSAILADALVEQARLEHLQYRETNADTTTWEADHKARLDAARQKIGELGMTSKRRQIVEAKLQTIFISELGKTRLAATRQAKTDTFEAATSQLIQAVATGDPIKIKEAMNYHAEAFTDRVDEAEQKALLARAVADGTTMRIQNLIAAGNYDEAEAVLNRDRHVLKDQGVALKTKIRVERNAAKERTNLIAEAYHDEQSYNILTSLAKDVNDYRMVDRLYQSAKDPRWIYWSKKIANRDRAKVEGRGDFFLQSDPALFNSLHRALTEAPTTVKEADIVDVVGHGLSVEDGIKLINKRRRMMRKDRPLNTRGFKQAKEKIEEAERAGLIKAPGYEPWAKEGSAQEKKNREIEDEIHDSLIEYALEEPRTDDELSEYADKLLKPHEVVAVRNYRWLTLGGFAHERERLAGVMAWQMDRDYDLAIDSLNAEGKKEWQYTERESGKGIFRQATTPRDFLIHWQSPNKIATKAVCRVYKKWARGDNVAARAMMIKDGWHRVP